MAALELLLSSAARKAGSYLKAFSFRKPPVASWIAAAVARKRERQYLTSTARAAPRSHRRTCSMLRSHSTVQTLLSISKTSANRDSGTARHEYFTYLATIVCKKRVLPIVESLHPVLRSVGNKWSLFGSVPVGFGNGGAIGRAA